MTSEQRVRSYKIEKICNSYSSIRTWGVQCALLVMLECYIDFWMSHYSKRVFLNFNPLLAFCRMHARQYSWLIDGLVIGKKQYALITIQYSNCIQYSNNRFYATVLFTYELSVNVWLRSIKRNKTKVLSVDFNFCWICMRKFEFSTFVYPIFECMGYCIAFIRFQRFFVVYFPHILSSMLLKGCSQWCVALCVHRSAMFF